MKNSTFLVKNVNVIVSKSADISKSVPLSRFYFLFSESGWLYLAISDEYIQVVTEDYLDKKMQIILSKDEFKTQIYVWYLLAKMILFSNNFLFSLRINTKTKISLTARSGKKILNNLVGQRWNTCFCTTSKIDSNQMAALLNSTSTKRNTVGCEYVTLTSCSNVQRFWYIAVQRWLHNINNTVEKRNSLISFDDKVE